jgi:hypothetical protein
MATLVKFRVHPANNDLFAFFPQLKASFNGYRHDNKVCYSHIGQHSECNIEYVKECRPATESEYLPLKRELESIGYTLKLVK